MRYIDEKLASGTYTSRPGSSTIRSSKIEFDIKQVSVRGFWHAGEVAADEAIIFNSFTVCDPEYFWYAEFFLAGLEQTDIVPLVPGLCMLKRPWIVNPSHSWGFQLRVKESMRNKITASFTTQVIIFCDIAKEDKV